MDASHGRPHLEAPSCELHMDTRQARAVTLVRRDPLELDRAFLGSEGFTDRRRFELDHGVRSIVLVRTRADHAVALAVVPDEVALGKHPLWEAEFLASVREAHDYRTH